MNVIFAECKAMSLGPASEFPESFSPPDSGDLTRAYVNFKPLRRALHTTVLAFSCQSKHYEIPPDCINRIRPTRTVKGQSRASYLAVVRPSGQDNLPKRSDQKQNAMRIYVYNVRTLEHH